MSMREVKAVRQQIRQANKFRYTAQVNQAQLQERRRAGVVVASIEELAKAQHLLAAAMEAGAPAHEVRQRRERVEAIHAAMDSVVNGRRGTGHSSRLKGIRVGGKTGSAENPHGERTHALFVAAAPMDEPEIAIGVIVENAGHGGSVAGPIAGALLKTYFKKTGRLDPSDSLDRRRWLPQVAGGGD